MDISELFPNGRSGSVRLCYSREVRTFNIELTGLKVTEETPSNISSHPYLLSKALKL